MENVFSLLTSFLSNEIDNEQRAVIEQQILQIENENINEFVQILIQIVYNTDNAHLIFLSFTRLRLALINIPKTDIIHSQIAEKLQNTFLDFYFNDNVEQLIYNYCLSSIIDFYNYSKGNLQKWTNLLDYFCNRLHDSPERALEFLQEVYESQPSEEMRDLLIQYANVDSNSSSFLLITLKIICITVSFYDQYEKHIFYIIPIMSRLNEQDFSKSLRTVMNLFNLKKQTSNVIMEDFINLVYQKIIDSNYDECTRIKCVYIVTHIFTHSNYCFQHFVLERGIDLITTFAFCLENPYETPDLYRETIVDLNKIFMVSQSNFQSLIPLIYAMLNENNIYVSSAALTFCQDFKALSLILDNCLSSDCFVRKNCLKALNNLSNLSGSLILSDNFQIGQRLLEGINSENRKDYYKMFYKWCKLAPKADLKNLQKNKLFEIILSEIDDFSLLIFSVIISKIPEGTEEIARDILVKVLDNLTNLSYCPKAIKTLRYLPQEFVIESFDTIIPLLLKNVDYLNNKSFEHIMDNTYEVIINYIPGIIESILEFLGKYVEQESCILDCSDENQESYYIYDQNNSRVIFNVGLLGDITSYLFVIRTIFEKFGAIIPNFINSTLEVCHKFCLFSYTNVRNHAIHLLAVIVAAFENDSYLNNYIFEETSALLNYETDAECLKLILSLITGILERNNHYLMEYLNKLPVVAIRLRNHLLKMSEDDELIDEYNVQTYLDCFVDLATFFEQSISSEDENLRNISYNVFRELIPYFPYFVECENQFIKIFSIYIWSDYITYGPGNEVQKYVEKLYKDLLNFINELSPKECEENEECFIRGAYNCLSMLVTARDVDSTIISDVLESLYSIRNQIVDFSRYLECFSSIILEHQNLIDFPKMMGYMIELLALMISNDTSSYDTESVQGCTENIIGIIENNLVDQTFQNFKQDLFEILTKLISEACIYEITFLENIIDRTSDNPEFLHLNQVISSVLEGNGEEEEDDED